MNILFLDAYFEPEQIAFTHLERDLLAELVDKGYRIHVICPIPTRGIEKTIASQYRRKSSENLYGGKVHVTRFWAPQERNHPLLRAFRYLWCNLRTYQMGKKRKDCDVVFSNSTPPTQGWIAGKVARRLKIPFVYSLQDVFPDSLITTGLCKKGSFLWKLGRKLEDSTYKACNKIVVITSAMRDNLLQKGVIGSKVQVISNWVDTEKIKPVRRGDNTLFDEFKIDGSKFIVLYAGNFGEAQGAEIVLDAAERLQSEKDIQFVIFGGGSGYGAAVEKAKPLSNVFIHSLMPQTRISEVYSMGNISLITCKKGIGTSGMPSKVWSIMACNVPIIAAFDKQSELNDILYTAHAGVCIDPGDVTAMIKEIKEMRQHAYESCGRAYVLANASRQYCVNRYLTLFSE